MSPPRVTALFAAGLALGLSMLSCSDIAPNDEDCELACTTASRCGMLPSALGGSPEFSKTQNEEDCVSRCLASDKRTTQVGGLLALLADDAASNSESSLCDDEGLRYCEELLEELEGTPATSELEITTRLTVRMASAVSHAANFALESWCCYNYQYDLEDGLQMQPDGEATSAGDGLDEVLAIYDMIQPTSDCLETIQQKADEATMALAPVTPEQEISEEDQQKATNACRVISDLWFPMPDGSGEQDAGPDCNEDPEVCRFARQSGQLQQLDILSTAVACDFESLNELRMAIKDTLIDWRLGPGDILMTDTESEITCTDDTSIALPQARPVEEIKLSIEAEIRDEIERPMGFLEEACEELYEELGDNACVELDRDDLLASGCSGGPACSAADCLLGDPPCDTTLCDADTSPPSGDCSFFGITEVRLGYRTQEGLEIFGDPIAGCSTLAEVESTFGRVKVGVIVPVALVSGDLSGSFTTEGATTSSRPFAWYVEGEPRWVSAGDATVQLPSPLLDYTRYLYENPLEYLEWVPRRFPNGQACDNQPALCETFFNENCDDGVDNDNDGLIDLDSAWCDPLFSELVDRCVVTGPGRQPPPECDDMVEAPPEG